MTTKRFPPNPLFLAFFIIIMLPFLICPANGETNYTQLNLTDIPIRVAQNLNIDTFSGQLLCSGILLMICLFPVCIIARSKNASWIPECAITVVMMGFCIGIGWLGVWFLLVICMLIAIMLATKLRTWLSGGA